MEGIDTESVEAPRTEIQDLPVEVRDYLMSFLDYGSRRTGRLVCHTLKESVDGVGISVKIDDRQPESIKLCNSLNVTEAQVQNMVGACPVVNLNLKKWRTVILSGPIDSEWMNTRVQRNCPYLRVLIVTGDCLTSQDFDGPIDLPVFEHLTQLRLSCSQDSWDEFPRPHFDRNMLYLLMSIRSRVLRVLELFVCSSLMTSTSLDFSGMPCWQYKALFDFIENHRNSLEELNTTNLGILLNRMQRHLWVQFNEEETVFQIPTKLKQFCWSVEQVKDVVFSSFWRDLLLSQESLERLSLDYADAFWFPLERILLTNARTLKVIILHLRNTRVLDMSLFSNLEVLQKMSIYGNSLQSPVTSVINLNQLPRTKLTSLNLIRVRIQDDFDGIEFMDGFQPETLELLKLSTSGLLSSRLYLRNFVKLLLRCRSLNVLHLAFVLPPPQLSRNFMFRKFTRTRLLEKMGLNLWLTSLSAQRPTNHFCTELDFRNFADYEQIRRQAFRAQDVMQYTDQSGGANVDYLELIEKKGAQFGFGHYQEQPFNFPRNAESYTISESPKNNLHFRILPNFQPYTMRINDVGHVHIALEFFIESNPTSELGRYKKQQLF